MRASCGTCRPKYATAKPNRWLPAASRRFHAELTGRPGRCLKTIAPWVAHNKERTRANCPKPCDYTPSHRLNSTQRAVLGRGRIYSSWIYYTPPPHILWEIVFVFFSRRGVNRPALPPERQFFGCEWELLGAPTRSVKAGNGPFEWWWSWRRVWVVVGN